MVTLKELAKLLHVSVSTVSKALSDSNEIGDATKKRVLELAKELNYKPNRIAQQLKSSKTKVIGVVVPSLINPFFAEVLHGIETTIAKADYDMIVCISNESLAKEKRSLELLANGSVDGF
jgi:LacI family transcriptional regulator